ncbi:acyltransferase family protein [Xenorhabdus bovienii]|uniref:acyltransferase family protein n=1 Tax=Xenorhabdus bovienii TaxID=40576 RepID=UPI0023B28F89|nr:acyltransferase [Xenorhabdus bovienii]MDE9484194.1 acyltransferase [Xenorhabdus bovienii]
MQLSTILNKDNNNLDIIRIIAACMVIYGHAYAISPKIGEDDLINTLLRFDYSGSLAVKIFFFISGLVVSNSLLKNRNILNFIISRFFRIWPALITTIVFGYLISICLSTISLEQFTKDAPFFKYFFNSMTLKFTWSFPGVFEGNNINTFNGSLWTIPYEVGAYIIMACSLSLVNYHRNISIALCIIVIIDPILLNGIIFTNSMHNEEIKFLPFCFSLGVLFSIIKDYIKINLSNLLMLFFIMTILKYQGSNLYIPFFYLTFFYFILYLSSVKIMLLLKPKYDISYGVYLWGFPVQQFIASYIGNMSIILNQIVSVIVALFFGFISWVIIEEKMMKIGRNISKSITK